MVPLEDWFLEMLGNEDFLFIIIIIEGLQGTQRGRIGG